MRGAKWESKISYENRKFKKFTKNVLLPPRFDVFDYQNNNNNYLNTTTN